MNHDIDHCNGQNCPIKQDCHRFLAVLNLRKNPHYLPVWYTSEQYDDSTGECPNYCQHHNVESNNMVSDGDFVK